MRSWFRQCLSLRTFRAERANQFEWKQPFHTVLDFNFHRSRGPIFCKWFEGGVTNVCHNAIDRHLPAKADIAAGETVILLTPPFQPY